MARKTKREIENEKIEAARIERMADAYALGDSFIVWFNIHPIVKDSPILYEKFINHFDYFSANINFFGNLIGDYAIILYKYLKDNLKENGDGFNFTLDGFIDEIDEMIDSKEEGKAIFYEAITTLMRLGCVIKLNNNEIFFTL